MPAPRFRLLSRSAGRGQVWRFDAAVAVGCAVVDVLLFVGGPGTSPVALASLAPGYLALGWRRTAPRAVLLVVLAHAALVAVVQPDVVPTLPALCAVYTVASLCPLRPSLEALVLATLVVAPGQVERERRDVGGQLPTLVAVELAVFVAVVVAVVWAAGRWVNSSRAQILTLEQRRAVAAAEAVAAERKRMARELHDVVSHAVSIMVLQAAGARRVLATQPARAEEALGRIENLGKQSMAELRRLLGLLHADDLVDGAGATDSVTRPGLDRVPELVSSFRDGGLDVGIEVVGHPHPLDGSVDLSAFRVVQESLTNAAKHAGPAAVVRVRQVWTDELLLLEITDDGPGGGAGPATDLSTGYGLVGLRERARAVGARLDAGPLPAGRGFRVSVSLPIRQRRTGQELTRLDVEGQP